MLIAAVATPLGTLLPLVGAPILALVVGGLVAALAPVPRALRPGLALTSRYVLQGAIVLLGTTISLRQVAHVGVASLPVMLGSLTAALLAAALLAAALIGRRLGIPPRLRTLIGVGTGICGASAIAAVSGPVAADEREVRYAVSTIFLFNLVAVLAFPALGHALGMSQHDFGLWAGTAVNDASSVVAAGYAYGHAAGGYAIVVKLTRTTTIVPIALTLAALRLRREGAGADGGLGRRALRVLPWFLVWFVVAAALNSLGLVDASARGAISHAGLALTTVALAAVGLSTDLGELRRTGARPLALGALVWLTVALVSVGLQRL